MADDDLSCPRRQVVIVEPFCGGSHGQLVAWLRALCPAATVLTLPAHKWHWRLRAGSLWAAEAIPPVADAARPLTLFASSMLNLCELLGVRPDLHRARKVLYFHENQLAFPTRPRRSRATSTTAGRR